MAKKKSSKKQKTPFSSPVFLTMLVVTAFLITFLLQGKALSSSSDAATTFGCFDSCRSNRQCGPGLKCRVTSSGKQCLDDTRTPLDQRQCKISTGGQADLGDICFDDADLPKQICQDGLTCLYANYLTPGIRQNANICQCAPNSTHPKCP